MTDYKEQVLQEYQAADGTIDRLWADVVQIKTAAGTTLTYQVGKVANRLRIGHSVCVISHKADNKVALVLNRTTRKTLAVECLATRSAMAKYVAGLILYALGAVVFFSGVIEPGLATKLGLGLFAIGLGVIVFTPVRDDNAYAQAFEAFVAQQWGTAPTTAASTFLRQSAFR